MDLKVLEEVLRDLTDKDIELLLQKGGTYGDSWKKRGGVGAFMMLARKWDRIEKAAQANDYDIFKAIDLVDYLIDDVIDLGCYLLLVRSENYRVEKIVAKNRKIVEDRKAAEEPLSRGYVDQDGDPWTKPVTDASRKIAEHNIQLRPHVTQRQMEELAASIRRWENEVEQGLATHSFAGLMVSHARVVESVFDEKQQQYIHFPMPMDKTCSDCGEDT